MKSAMRSRPSLRPAREVGNADPHFCVPGRALNLEVEIFYGPIGQNR